VLRIQGVRVPHYNRRADLVCFVNGLPLVFIELKAVYRNIRAGFDHNLTDYLSEHSIAHAFHHNAFVVVSNGDAARYGPITSHWEHFVAWKRNAEKDNGRLDAEALLDGMLAKDRLLDLVGNFILFDDSRAGGTRKIVARNHQVLGVNNAVASVLRQEVLKRRFPSGERLIKYRVPKPRMLKVAEAPPPDSAYAVPLASAGAGDVDLPLMKRAHADLGRFGGVLAQAGQRQILFDGLLRREGAPRSARQLHLPRDDRSRGPGRPDLACVRSSAAG
jgi:type I restriction enzyme, R subunit